MPRPGKRRRLTVVDLRDSDAMFVALMRLLDTLAQRHPEHRAELAIAERILDGVQDRNRGLIEAAEVDDDLIGLTPEAQAAADREQAELEAAIKVAPVS